MTALHLHGRKCGYVSTAYAAAVCSLGACPETMFSAKASLVCRSPSVDVDNGDDDVDDNGDDDVDDNDDDDVDDNDDDDVDNNGDDDVDDNGSEDVDAKWNISVISPV